MFIDEGFGLRERDWPCVWGISGVRGRQSWASVSLGQPF